MKATIKQTWFILILTSVVLLTLSKPVLCELPPGSEQFAYRAFLLGAQKGVPAASLSFESLSASDSFRLPHGTLSFVGSIFPPPPDAAFSFFPNRLRVSISHVDNTGKVISRDVFDLAVQDAGKILRQEYPLTHDVILGQNEKLLASLTPLDSRLPACLFNITIRLTPAGTVIPVETTPEIPFPRPGTLEAIVSFSRPIAAHPKGQEFFHCKMGRPGGKGLVLIAGGTLSVSGIFTPAAAGTPFSANVEMRVKHIDSTGKMTSVDSNEIHVLPTGKIPLQKFPFSTIGPDHKPEKLEISFVPIDAGIPAGDINVRFDYSR